MPLTFGENFRSDWVYSGFDLPLNGSVKTMLPYRRIKIVQKRFFVTKGRKKKCLTPCIRRRLLNYPHMQNEIEALRRAAERQSGS